MLTTQDATRSNATTLTEDFFDPIVLHYIQKGMIAESAVLGTEILALCGERWSADETDYAATGRAGGGAVKTVMCPLCGDISAGLP